MTTLVAVGLSGPYRPVRGERTSSEAKPHWEIWKLGWTPTGRYRDKSRRRVRYGSFEAAYFAAEKLNRELK